jgi:hypothetical protein
VSERNGGISKPPTTSKKRKQALSVYQRTVIKLRRIFGTEKPENAAEAREAVGHFLTEMSSVAARTYPAWSKVLTEGLSEHALNYDERRALLEVHPIDDYYFAGVVALDAARIRLLYDPPEATELLGEIGAQVDGAAGRQDRVVSDLVFLMLSRLTLGAGDDQQKAPYDKVVKILLQQIGIHKIDATKGLMRDKGFRHLLGEPLATGVPQWWKSFQSKFTLYWAEPEEMDELETEMALQALAANTAPVPVPRVRQRRVRRAASFLGGD